MAETSLEELKVAVNTRGQGKVHLELEGTVLTFSGRRGGADWQAQVPIELVSIIQKRHSKLKQIIIPLGFFLVCATACFGIAPIFDFYSAEAASLVRLIGACFVFILIIAIPISLVMAIFERKTRYVYISVVPMNYQIEFWVSKQIAPQIDKFIESIQARQVNIADKPAQNIFPMVLSKHEYKSLPKFVAFLYISCLPALFLEKPTLLFLCLIPICWFVLNRLRYLAQPKEYRQAVRNYLKENLEKSLTNLQFLLRALPDRVPALLLTTKIYIEQQEYDKALEITNRIQDVNIDLARDLEKYIFNCKRINQRKMELSTEQD